MIYIKDIKDIIKRIEYKYSFICLRIDIDNAGIWNPYNEVINVRAKYNGKEYEIKYTQRERIRDILTKEEEAKTITEQIEEMAEKLHKAIREEEKISINRKTKIIVDPKHSMGRFFVIKANMSNEAIIVSSIEQLEEVRSFLTRKNRIFVRGKLIGSIKRNTLTEYEKLCDMCDEITGSKRKEVKHIILED